MILIVMHYFPNYIYNIYNFTKLYIVFYFTEAETQYDIICKTNSEKYDWLNIWQEIVISLEN